MRTSDALRVRPPYNAPHRTTPRFNIELGSSLERDVGDCAINGSERTMFSMRTAVFVIVGALVVLLLGVSAPIVRAAGRSEEHTSELQSQSNLVCRLLLEKKKTPTRRSSTQRTRACKPTRRS